MEFAKWWLWVKQRNGKRMQDFISARIYKTELTVDVLEVVVPEYECGEVGAAADCEGRDALQAVIPQVHLAQLSHVLTGGKWHY